VPDQTKLTHWILNTLRQNGWSIREFARRAGVSHVAITRVLNAYGSAGAELCLALARATHTPVETLLELAGLIPSYTPDTAQEQREYELLNYFRLLDPGGQRALMTLARALHEDRAEYTVEKEKEDK